MADLKRDELREVITLEQKAIEMLEQVQAMFRTSFEGLMKNNIIILDKVLKDEKKITEVYRNLTTFAVEISKKHLSDRTIELIVPIA